MRREQLTGRRAWGVGLALALALYVPHAVPLIVAGHVGDCPECSVRWSQSLWMLPGFVPAELACAALARVLDASTFARVADALRAPLAILAVAAYLAGMTWFALRERAFAWAALVVTLALASLSSFGLTRLFAM